MDEAFLAALERYRRRERAEEISWRTEAPATLLARRDEFLLHIGEEVGRFLHALAIARRATRILELGTSYGYSTLFLADAARATGGAVLTLELDSEKQRFARAEIEAAGLGGRVEWHCGDALSMLPKLDGPFDLVLVDLWKELYVPCLSLFHPKLADNAVVVADNMLLPSMARPEAEAYRAAVRAHPDLQTVLLPIGSGIELSCVWRRPPL